MCFCRLYVVVYCSECDVVYIVYELCELRSRYVCGVSVGEKRHDVVCNEVGDGVRCV